MIKMNLQLLKKFVETKNSIMTQIINKQITTFAIAMAVFKPSPTILAITIIYALTLTSP